MPQPVQQEHGLCARLERLEGAGVNPYPYRFDRTHTADQTRAGFHGVGHEPTEERVRAMGRVMGTRRHAATIFLDLVDWTGKIQIVVSRGETPALFDQMQEVLSLGDLVGATGPVLRTRRGELSIRAYEIVILAKTLRPLPDKFHGIADPGMLRDQRHLHLIIDDAARRRFQLRSRSTSLIRHYLEEQGFIEVTTPILQEIYGGAEAEPFITYCNALERDMYLRIAPELYLKRLVIGGLERVYEIGPNFRNEGVSARHSPEFTALEAYQLGADYNDMMALAEGLLCHLATEIAGGSTLTSHLSGHEVEVDLTLPFRRLTVLDAVQEYAGVDFEDVDDVEARRIARLLHVPVGDECTADDILMWVFEACVEPHLVQPTFILDYPYSHCPLTKQHRSNPRFAERFELYIDRTELANAYSELTDPRQQRRQFSAQATRRAQGDGLAHLPNSDYCSALEYGLGPTGGLGIGIDRLMMLLLGAHHIQDVILFPLRAR